FTAAFIAAQMDWKIGVKPLEAFSSTGIRHAILAKNQLFFNRWRPENSTYLFLFRKHEQGKNAQEIPKFDPLIQAEEEKIAKLRRESPKTTLAQDFAHKPKQTPVTEHPATPIRPQPI